jgi:pyruvate,orthophosphate dikinase
MQARAIFEGAIAAKRKTGVAARVEIMTPLVIDKAEFDLIKAQVEKLAQTVAAETGETIDYSFGTMIETPRACLRAAELAKTAEFFSFGTNDLTQTCLALSRDDAGSFLGEYVAKGILPGNPFATIDQEGVGEFIEIAVARGRQSRPDIKIGICGEHAGDPASIAFFEGAGLSYVSCSSFRVPVARLAAAQAALGVKSAK